jgi:GPH family glycoside/pentoside/hexuronide:cation symporter
LIDRAPTARLPRGKLIAFSTLIMPVAAVQIPLTVYLPAIFAQHFGLSLPVLGLIFLLEKIWGTLADPIVGALSDRWRGPFGRRRSFILAGSVLFAAAGLCLFFPQSKVGPIYLGAVLFVFYLGLSMVQIPFFAWSGELSRDYDERTRIATYQSVASSIALLLILLFPALIDQLRAGDMVLKLNAMGALLLGMLTITVSLTLRAFREPPLLATVAGPAQPLRSLTLLLGNRLLLRVLASDFAVSVGQGFRGTLFLFFVGMYMGVPRWASGFFLVQFIFGMAAGPLWMWVGYRIGKHRAAVCGELVQVLINLALLLVTPGRMALLIALVVAQGLAQGSGNLMLRSMVADVADKHRFETGEDRAGLFFSVFSISSKAALAAAVGVALPLVAWFGFDAKSMQNTPAALHGLLLVFALGPALAHLLSAALLLRFPLDAKAYALIREGLELRDAKVSHSMAR